jgi:hypothetical protein
MNILNIPKAGDPEVGDFFDQDNSFNVWKFMYKQERF